jgi:hypothetical protein
MAKQKGLTLIGIGIPDGRGIPVTFTDADGAFTVYLCGMSEDEVYDYDDTQSDPAAARAAYEAVQAVVERWEEYRDDFIQLAIESPRAAR